MTKSVRRQTLTDDSFDGTYNLTYPYVTYECADPARNVTGNAVGKFRFNQTNAQGSMSLSFPLKDGGRCDITSAKYEQVGRLGKFWGWASCTNGDSGPGSVYEMAQDRNGVFTALAYVESNNGSKCKTLGGLVGVRALNN